MATKTKRAEVNGKVVKYDANEDSATLRRVATALPRDAGVDRITTPPTADATVWFAAGDALTDCYFVGHHVDVVDVFVSSSGHGNVGVNVNL